MKRIAALLLCLILLASSTALAAAPGSASDPLITRSFAEESILAPLLEQNTNAISRALAERYEAASAALDVLYDNALIRIRGYEGYTLSARLVPITLRAGAQVDVLTGGSFVLTGGDATVSIVRGTVVNASTGDEVMTGASLRTNQRYFCAENTMAVFTAGESAEAMVDGLHLVDEMGSAKLPFRDVAADRWYYSAVRFVYGRGLFQGTSGTTFSPEKSMTRAMFVTVLYRLAGSPEAGGSSFPDVADSSSWYYAPVAWAAGRGIVNGYEDGLFRPDNSVTREQMAVIVYNYVRAIGGDTSGGGNLSAFPDGGSVSGWAREAMQWAVAHGIINGSDGYLLPRNTATRAQVAQIMKNCCDRLGL
ncbi:MAG: S-layer homology domain-containing protein [Oscillospiraceae bacterium]|nr:S-layer homology domain-containing protein [Oscillospiraceae bacterium]